LLLVSGARSCAWGQELNAIGKCRRNIALSFSKHKTALSAEIKIICRIIQLQEYIIHFTSWDMFCMTDIKNIFCLRIYGRWCIL